MEKIKQFRWKADHLLQGMAKVLITKREKKEILWDARVFLYIECVGYYTNLGMWKNSEVYHLKK
jgi:hypothetical protein